MFHYVPLHLSAMGRKLGYQVGDCPITEQVSDRLVRLPFYNELTQAEQRRVIEAIQSPIHRVYHLWLSYTAPCTLKFGARHFACQATNVRSRDVKWKS